MTIAASLGTAALAGVASSRVVLYLGAAIVVVVMVASFTWLRTLKLILAHERADRRVPTIGKVLVWENQSGHQGQLFQMPRSDDDRRGRRSG